MPFDEVSELLFALVSPLEREGNQLAVSPPRESGLVQFVTGQPRERKVRFEINHQTHVRPELLHAIVDLAAFIRERQRYAVGGVLSAADYVATTRFLTRSSDPEARRNAERLAH